MLGNERAGAIGAGFCWTFLNFYDTIIYMVTISIDKKYSKSKDLIAISRSEYERLVGRVPTPKKSLKKPKSKIDKNHFLWEAVQDAKHGRTSGPFNTVEELTKHLMKK